MQKLLKTASFNEGILWLFRIQFGLILINVPIFGEPFIFSIFSAIIFSCIPFLALLIQKRESLISISGKTDYTACYLLFALSLYYIIGTYLRSQQFSLLHLYYLSLPCFLSFMQYALGNRYKKDFLRQAYYWFFCLAALESVLCFLQYGTLVAVQSNYFNVTGTTQNPNVTAMFLAMSVPAILAVYTSTFKNIYKLFYFLALTIILAAMLLLKCRTALAGAVLATILFLFLNNRNSFTKKLSKSGKNIGIILLSLCLILFAYGLYISKKESAEGRFFIWQTATQYIVKNPLIGSGLGMLERDYNMEQAMYFKKQGINSDGAENAMFIQVLYNEYISSLFEGGLLGFTIFIIFLLVIIKGLVKVLKGYFKNREALNKHQLAACIGIPVFLGMSLVNFTINAVPVMLLFLFYSAVVINKASEDKVLEVSPVYKVYYYRLASVIATVCLLVTLKQASLFFQVGKMIKFNSEKDYQSAFNIGGQLRDGPPWTSRFWAECGYAAFQLNKYKIAAQCFTKAVTTTANPEYFMMLSDAHLKYKSLKHAITGYEIASNIQPHKLRPRYSLIQLNLYRHDTTAATRYAREILQIVPKVNNEKAAFYKKEAQLFLNKTGK